MIFACLVTYPDLGDRGDDVSWIEGLRLASSRVESVDPGPGVDADFGSAWPVLRRLHPHHSNMIRSIRLRTPPTTPPTIGPVEEELDPTSDPRDQSQRV